jgi:1-deoxy-D-xylulose-5-phosphate synthase
MARSSRSCFIRNRARRSSCPFSIDPDSPADLRALPEDQLEPLADEVRERIVDVVSDHKGAHFGSNLGTVELTIALHRVFETPRDQLVWDVGHQAYPHKILTGRNDRAPDDPQADGLAPFLRRDESEYDVFGAGHAATSISAAVGIAAARDLKGEDFEVIAVIGDGSMTCGSPSRRSTTPATRIAT